MTWIKKGLIFNVEGEYHWNKTHAQCPVVDVVDEQLWRIYYATRNSKGQSQISYFEVKAGAPDKITYKHNTYLFDLGEPGTFDDSGVMPTCIVTLGNLKYLYYIGWTLKATVPYHNAIGIAVSHDNGKSFEKLHRGSIMPSIATEPYFTGTSYVMKEGHLWRMWYLSCVKWELINNKHEPLYHIKYAESKDGINWKRDGVVAIDFKAPDEGGIASAAVLKDAEGYKMWYAYRSAFDYRTEHEKSYRIGYAVSVDGVSWTRKDDEVGISCSKQGWDSFMMAYPYVISHKGDKYMFYNGNGFGQSGIGYAIKKG